MVVDELITAIFVVWLLGYVGGIATWIMVRTIFEEDRS